MEGVVKEENLPPGFRFHPTDEELIIFYLARKIADSSFTSSAIGNIDLNRCEPWDLPGKAKMGEKEWYFFSLRDRKYPTGLRTNRATDAGYWKTTGKDKEVYDSTNSELAGMKKTLVFYKGRAPKGEKTNWVMHEYRIQPNGTLKSGKDEWVVCRVFKKSCGGIKLRGNPIRAAPFNLEASSAALSSLLQQEPGTFNLGRSNYLSNLDLMDLRKVLRVGSLVNTNCMAGLQPQPSHLALQQLGSCHNVLAAPAARQNNVSSLSMPVNGHGLPVKMPIPASAMAARFTLPSDMELEPVMAGGDPPHAVDSSRLGGGYWPASY